MVYNPNVNIDDLSIEKFQEFCEVDLQLTHRTALTHASRIRSFLECIKRRVISVDDIRSFLKFYKDNYNASYGGMISSLKRFFRDYLNAECMVRTFRHPTPTYEIKVNALTKDQLEIFYEAIRRPKHRAYFLLLAASGLRKGEP